MRNFGAAPTFTSFDLLCGDLARSILDGKDPIWLSSPEALLIEVFNEDRKGSFPWFLVVVGQLAQLSWVQTQFASHLDVSVGQVKRPARLDPSLQLFG
jgi:hypothetical protein